MVGQEDDPGPRDGDQQAWLALAVERSPTIHYVAETSGEGETCTALRFVSENVEALAFGQRCAKAGVKPSMGSVGDCYDNAMCESFFATLECELLDRQRFRSQAEARRAVFEFIEGWYNPRRRHSSIGYLSPVNYERSLLPPARPSP